MAKPTIADLMAERDAQNKPPDGVSYKAWHAMRKGWVPREGSKYYAVWLEHFGSPDSPWLIAGEIIGRLLIIGGVVLLLYYLFVTERPTLMPGQICLDDVARDLQPGCIELQYEKLPKHR